MSGNSSSEASGTFDRSNTSSADACYGAVAVGESSDNQASLASSSTDEGSRRQTSKPRLVEALPSPTKRTSPSPPEVKVEGVVALPSRPGREKTPRRTPPLPVAALPLQDQGPIGTIAPMVKQRIGLMPPRQLSRSRSESAGSARYGRRRSARAIAEEPYPTSSGRVSNEDAPIADLRRPVANGVSAIVSNGGGGDDTPPGGEDQRSST